MSKVNRPRIHVTTHALAIVVAGAVTVAFLVSSCVSAEVDGMDGLRADLQAATSEIVELRATVADLTGELQALRQAFFRSAPAAPAVDPAGAGEDTAQSPERP